MNTYLIRLQGQVDVAELNAGSPHQMRPVTTGPDKARTASTALTIRTDQAGLIGMLRHLHQLGLTLLSIETLAETVPPTAERKSP